MSGYTIGEIAVWLLLAAALGFVLGWIMRELFLRAGRGSDAATPVRGPVRAPEPVTPTEPAEKAPKQAPAKKTPAKKTPAKKAPAKKAPAKKVPAKKTTARKTTKRVPPSIPPETRDDTPERQA